MDSNVVTLLSKKTWSPRKGLESVLKNCQDKLLDVLGPLAKFFELTKSIRLNEQPLDPAEVSGWVQRAICTTGNVNTTLAIER